MIIYLASTVVIGSEGADKTITKPGYYGWSWANEHHVVYVAGLNCPDQITLEEAKRAAGVMTVRAYITPEGE